MNIKRYIPLFEDSLIEQKLLESIQSISVSSELYDNLYTMYEWEYKLSVLKRKFQKMQKRRFDNIILQIHKKLKPILDHITDKLAYVFKKWLDTHAITSPRTWAERRAEEIVDNYDVKNLLRHPFYEYTRYTTPKGNTKTAFVQKVLEALEGTHFFDEMVDLELSDLEDQVEGTRDEEDIEYYKSVIQMLNTDPVEYYAEIMTFDVLNTYINPDLLIKVYEKVVFPVWFKHWKAKGIVQTRKGVEKAYNDLEKSYTEKDLSKRIMYINIALNTQHQTGSMMEYIEGLYDVSEKDLNHLSNMDNKEIQEWEKEIIELGVY